MSIHEYGTPSAPVDDWLELGAEPILRIETLGSAFISSPTRFMNDAIFCESVLGTNAHRCPLRISHIDWVDIFPFLLGLNVLKTASTILLSESSKGEMTPAVSAVYVT